MRIACGLSSALEKRSGFKRVQTKTHLEMGTPPPPQPNPAPPPGQIPGGFMRILPLISVGILLKNQELQEPVHQYAGFCFPGFCFALEPDENVEEE